MERVNYSEKLVPLGSGIYYIGCWDILKVFEFGVPCKIVEKFL